jgi:hypothetical protein
MTQPQTLYLCLNDNTEVRMKAKANFMCCIFTDVVSIYTVQHLWECGPLLSGRSRDRIPVNVTFSAYVHIGPGAHPAACTMGTGPYSGARAG